MSYYLSIKKNGVPLGIWSRSTRFYEVFNHGAPFDNWEVFDVLEAISLARDSIDDIRANETDQLNLLNKVFVNLTNYEDLYDTAIAITECENSLKECDAVIVMLDMLENCYEASAYDTDTDNIWTWCIS